MEQNIVYSPKSANRINRRKINTILSMLILVALYRVEKTFHNDRDNIVNDAIERFKLNGGIVKILPTIAIDNRVNVGINTHYEPIDAFEIIQL